jgi:1,2-phenylacetyl-CoA epoxidase PaaB subunit
MDTADVMTWVDGYIRAWRDADAQAVEHLFTSDAGYRVSPYEPTHVGHAAIQRFWREDEGRTFTAEARPVAVDRETAVVRVDVVYLEPRRQEYADLWVLRFAEDGRVREYEEWAYWPGKSYTAAGENG